MWPLKLSVKPCDKAPPKCQTLFIISDAELWVFRKVFTAHWGIGDWVCERLRPAECVCGCLEVCSGACAACSVYVHVCVCGPVQNKSGHSSAGLACAEHIRNGKERQAFIFSRACWYPNGDHMPESSEESFCAIKTKSLGVPHCWGPEIKLHSLIREASGSQWNPSKAQITTCHDGSQATDKTVKILTSCQTSCITLLITNSVGFQIPPLRPPPTPSAVPASPLLHL